MKVGLGRNHLLKVHKEEQINDILCNKVIEVKSITESSSIERSPSLFFSVFWTLNRVCLCYIYFKF